MKILETKTTENAVEIRTHRYRSVVFNINRSARVVGYPVTYNGAGFSTHCDNVIMIAFSYWLQAGLS